MSKSKANKLTLFSLILMIFTSVYGFANMPRAFFLMGYAAIPWYLLGALFFFLPYAFMVAEYGAAFKKEKGGIYSWMTWSVGPKYAFIATFMWYASYVVWQVNVSSSIWVPLSNAFLGRDITQELTFFGLQGSQVLGLLAIFWIIAVTFIASKGIDKIKQITSVGGIAVSALNLLLLIGGIIVLGLNKGQLAQPIADQYSSIVRSPNPSYQSPVAILSFLTFAIFAYGGIEAVGGLVDQTENPQRNFPKGLMISAIIISIGYAIGIFMIGTFIHWDSVLSDPYVNMANVTYIVMQNLGFELARGFSLSMDSSLLVGAWVARFVGLSMFLSLTGAFFTLIYSPLKQLIEGTPKEIWPGKLGEIKDGMPIYAMIAQAIIVIVFIALVSFGGQSAAAFFDKLVIMTNVAMTIPYMFVAAAFPSFKSKDTIEKPFVFYKKKKLALIVSIIVVGTVGFANIFSILEPALTRGLIVDSLFSIGGPVFFGVIAFIIYRRYENNYLK